MWGVKKKPSSNLNTGKGNNIANYIIHRPFSSPVLDQLGQKKAIGLRLGALLYKSLSDYNGRFVKNEKNLHKEAV